MRETREVTIAAAPYRYLVIGSIFLIYTAVRFWGLNSSCLWFDEIFGVHAAEHSWGGMFRFVALDLIHPPLFYVLVKLWIGAGGESPEWLRFFSYSISILTVVPFLQLCRELKLSHLTTAIAFLVFAVNGALIKYAQEVRMYSLLLFLSTVSIWLFARFFYRGKNIWILSLVNVLLVYTHYYGWLLVLAEVVAILALQRIKIRDALVVASIALVSYVPWIWAVWTASSAGADARQNIGWIERPGVRSLLDFVFDVIEPFYFQQSSAEPSTLVFITVPLLVLVIVAKASYLSRFRLAEDSNFTILSVLTAVPVFTALLLSWTLPYSVWGSRHLIIVFVPMTLLMGKIFSEFENWILRSLLIYAILLILAASFVVRWRTPTTEKVWCAWEKLADRFVSIPHYSSEPKTLYAFEDLVAYHVWFALREAGNCQVIRVTGVEGLGEDRAYFLPRGFDDVAVVNISQVKGNPIYIAFRTETPEEQSRLPFISPPPKQPLLTFLNSGYSQERTEMIDVGGQSAYVVMLIKDPTGNPMP